MRVVRSLWNWLLERVSWTRNFVLRWYTSRGTWKTWSGVVLTPNQTFCYIYLRLTFLEISCRAIFDDCKIIIKSNCSGWFAWYEPLKTSPILEVNLQKLSSYSSLSLPLSQTAHHHCRLLHSFHLHSHCHWFYRLHCHLHILKDIFWSWIDWKKYILKKSGKTLANYTKYSRNPSWKLQKIVYFTNKVYLL